MKHSKLGYFITLGLTAMASPWAETPEALPVQDQKPVTVVQQQNPEDITHVSKAFGHMIGKNLTLLGIEFDMDCVMQGIRDSLDGKSAPLSEEDCIAAITNIQKANFDKTAALNLAKANTFMEENSQKTGVVEIEKHKVQYKIEKEGKGTTVKEGSTPLIKYTGRFINGQVFTSSQEEERITLQETMAGFAKGIEGMQEGEKRVVFIHPERAYGTSGYLAPNSTLIFEIEVVKADSPEEEDLSEVSEMAVDLNEAAAQKTATIH